MADVIYVLTNRAMPGLVKIGRTSGRLEDRMRQLDSTGVPLPFECFTAWEVENAMIAEHALHVAFGDHRIRDRREFFRIGEDKPTAILKAFGLRNVTPGDDVVEEEEDRRALEKARSRRPNFKFSMVGIERGTVLQSLFDESVTCVVEDDKQVQFRNKIMSLSSAALIVAHENGKNWSAITGAGYWKYEDQTLWDLRDLEEADDA